MDENTRRQVTWVMILGLIAIIAITAGYRRGELKRLAGIIAEGTPTERIAAVRTLVEKQKLTEALDEQPRWVQDNAMVALAYLGDNETLLEGIGSTWLLDKPVVPRTNDVIVSFNRAAITPLVEAMQDKDGNVRSGSSAPLIAIGKPTIPPLVNLISAWDQYVRDGIVAVFSGYDPKIAPALTPSLVPVMKQKAPKQDQSPAEFLRSKGTARAALVGMKVPALPAIMGQLLPSTDPDVRADAAAMIGEIDATAGVPEPEIKKTIPALLNALNTDSVWTVRRKAATSLGNLPKVDDTTKPKVNNAFPKVSLADKYNNATDSLIAHLSDARNEVKAASAEALGKVGNPKAAGPLANTLVANRTGAVREISIALIALGKPAVPALQAALRSPEEEIRRTATETVGQVGGTDSVVPLASMLRDSSEAIRETASDALRGLADGRVVGQLIAALDDNDWRVYHAARDALVHVKEPAVGPLIAGLGGGNPRVSYMAEQALARIGAPAISQLTGALASASPAVADWAGVALGDIGGDAVAATAVVLAKSSASVTARSAAARALGRTGVAAAVKPLMDTFASAQAPVQVAIVKALDRLSAADGTPTLVAALQISSPDVRQAAMQVLQNWRIGDVQKLLQQVVSSGDENAKRRAAIVLAEQNSLATGALLSQALGVASEKSQDIGGQLRPILEAAAVDASETRAVRAGAVRSLGYLGQAESLPQLQQLLEPGNPLAGEAAKAVAMVGQRQGEALGEAARGKITEAAQLLVDLLKSTPDDKLRLQTAVALSLMRAQPVKALVDSLATAPTEIRPWIAATLAAIGKPATDPVLDARGTTKDKVQKAWSVATLQLIGDAQALDLIKHLPDEEQPDPATVAEGQKVLDRIRAARR